MKEKAIGKIIVGLLICLMLGLVFGGLIDATSATNEKTTISVTESSSLPDLIVEDIAVYPDPPYTGGGVRVFTKIKNRGNADVIGSFSVKLYFDGTYTGEYNEIDGLPAGASKNFIVGVILWPADTNPHVVKCVIDPDNTITESNEGNNERSESFSAVYNQPPTLSTGYVDPPSGDTSTVFNYYVTYKDPDGDAPLVHFVSIESGHGHYSSYSGSMTKVSGDYKSGAIFKYSTTLPALPAGEDYVYSFYFEDGRCHRARLPPSGIYYGPTVTAITRDTAVTAVQTSPDLPTVGQATTIYVTVKNEGNQQEKNVPVKAYVDGSQVGSAQVTLSAGKSTTKSFSWTPSTAKTYSVKGEVGIVSGETDTSNNKKTINVEVNPAPVHDMAVTKVDTTPSSPTVGQSTTIYVTVKNKGNQQEKNVPVKAYVDGSQVGSAQVTLSAGKSTTKSFTWTPSTAKTYSVKGEVGIVSGKTDTSDNKKTKSVSVQQPNQPPTCVVELRQQGTTTTINEIGIGEFFDIHVGGSTDDQDIKEVRFSSDNSQDGNPTGTWTGWDDWDTSSEDWNAISKTKAWLFTTEGSKEVWAEVKDGDGQTRNCFASIVTENLYRLAKAIMSEASVGTQEERIAVGWTVLNRLDSNEFPSTIKQVVESGYAYNQEPTQDIIDLSKDILERKYSDPTGGATHFFSPQTQNIQGGYGPFKIPGSDNKTALIPNWAIPEEYGEKYNKGLILYWESLPPSPLHIWGMPGNSYRTIDSPALAAEWVGSLENIINWYFMFYRPISSPSVAKPVLSSPLEITPEKDKYYVGDTLTAQFTITNKGTQPITFDKLTVGGRLNDDCPDDKCPDFTFRSTTLQPNVPYQYTGTFTLTHSGNYHFFIAYYIENPTPEEKKLLDENNWNTCIDLGEELTDKDRIKDITVGQIEAAPTNLLVHTKGEFAPTQWGIGVYHYLTWDYSFDTEKGFVIQEKFVPDPLIYANPKQINWPYPIGFHEVGRVGADVRRYKIATPVPTIYSAHTKEYRIASIFADDQLSLWSNIARIYPYTISPPADLEATVTKAPLQVKLTWKDMSNNEIGFYIYRWEGIGTGPWIESPDHEWPLLATVDANAEAFIGTDVRQGYTIKYVIKAFNDVDLSPPSYVVVAYIPFSDEIPPLPTNNPTNIILAHMKSPAELRVYDSLEQVTGLVKGEIKEEIPNSIYTAEKKTVIIFSPEDSYRYEAVGTGNGTYGLTVTSVEDGNVTTFTAIDIPTTEGVRHQYAIDWNTISQGKNGTTLIIDSDDDGIFEKTVTADDELSQENYFALMPKTIYVPDDYAKIQYAADNAGTGDTIIVRDGTHIENINVNKRLTIKSENGSENCIVQAADPGDSVFEVTADHVNIIGFTVKGTTAAYAAGIWLKNANQCYIANNIASKNSNGIVLDSSMNNRIHDSNADSNYYHGIWLRSSSQNTIEYNNASNNGINGIYLEVSRENIIANNTCSNNKNGIFLHDSSSNNISNNTCSSNKNAGGYYRDIGIWTSRENVAAGITLWNSKYNSISNNTCLYNDDGIIFWRSNRNSIYNNTLNEGGAGITLWNSKYNSISNNTCLYHKADGITLFQDSTYNSIYNNTCSHNSCGISCHPYRILEDSTYIPPVGSNHNSISNNICSYNSEDGINLKDSEYNSISNNICSNNYYISLSAGEYYGDGISLWASNNNSIYNNTCSYNSDGISLRHSTNNSISNNTCSYNMYDGISIQADSNDNNVYNNTCSYNEYDGISIEDSDHNNICNNTCSCNRIGISLGDSKYYTPHVGSNHNNICNNTCSHNSIGIYLRVSNCCSISKNHCSSNDDYGIYLAWSDKNFIYLNNFINNANNADSYGTNNIWNSIEKITYVYNGTTYTNYLGNHWEDYTGADTKKDGIGDTSYSINSDKDIYPLMETFENYI